MREKISVGRRFLPFLLDKHNNFPCLMACAFCLFVCVLLMTPPLHPPTRPYWAVSAPPPLPAADCHTQQGDSSPPDLAETGHFSVSWRTIRVGTRQIRDAAHSLFSRFAGASPRSGITSRFACAGKGPRSREPEELLVDISSRPTGSPRVAFVLAKERR